MTYFDNAATSCYKPKEVINAVTNTLKYISANPGRSGHSMSAKAAMLVHRTRTRLADFAGCADSDRVVFTLNCTAALNAAIFGTVKPGGHVITTAYEHNSMLRPLFELQRQGIISVTVLPPSVSGFVTANQIERSLKPNTYMLALNHISNVTGAKTDLFPISKLASKNSLLLLIDGAQSVGHDEVLLDDMSISLLAIAPHKGILAPQGVGALLIGRNVRVKPSVFGGTGTDSESVIQPQELPESLESGTLPTPAIAGLNAALIWQEKNAKAYREKVTALTEFAIDSLRRMHNITVYNPHGAYNGIASFNILGLTSVEVSGILSDEYDICVRGGLHCAPLIHKHLNTIDGGIVRVSFGYDNTYAEVESFLQAIQEISGQH